MSLNARKSARRARVNLSEAIANLREATEVYLEEFPFDVVIRSKTTKKAIKDTDTGKNLIVCENAEDMFCL